MTEKKSFIMYLDTIPQWDILSYEQKGKLIEAMLYYAKTGENQKIDDAVVNVVFAGMKATLDRDAEKYEKRCKRNADSARKRWGKKEAVSENTNSSEMRTDAKYADSDNDSDSDSDKDSDSDNDRDSDKENVSSSSISKVVEKYVKICKPLCQPNLTPELTANIRKALNFYGIDDLTAVFETVTGTPFLNGQVSEWQADLAWIFTEGNIDKILSGKYKEYNRKPVKKEYDPELEKYKCLINNFPDPPPLPFDYL